MISSNLVVNMSKIELSLRLHGKLPPTEELNSLLGVVPTIAFRQGQIVGKRRIQPTDVWCLSLAEIECSGTENEIDQMKKQMQQAVAGLQQVAPALAALDRSACKVELYISTIRQEDRGGFSLPGGIIAAAAAANLSSIEVSILVMLDDYEEPEI